MIDRDIKKGFKFGLGFFLFFGILFGLAWASGFHTANEILGGTFLGDYKFSGKVEIDKLILNNSDYICESNLEGSLRYNGTSKDIELCNGTHWNELGDSISSEVKNEVIHTINDETLLTGTVSGCQDQMIFEESENPLTPGIEVLSVGIKSKNSGLDGTRGAIIRINGNYASLASAVGQTITVVALTEYPSVVGSLADMDFNSPYVVPNDGNTYFIGVLHSSVSGCGSLYVRSTPNPTFTTYPITDVGNTGTLIEVTTDYGYIGNYKALE
jgi:hypothetical protein